MKHIYLCLLSSALALTANAQCPNDNQLVAGSLTPPGLSQTTNLTYNTGQYVTATVVAGATYRISTCNNTTTDTQISVYDDATGTYIMYNDDFCNLQSELTFTASSCGVVRVVLDEYPCTASNFPVQVAMTQMTAGAGTLTVTPTITPVTCNNNGSVSLVVTGGSGPYSYFWTPGNYTTSTVNNLAPGSYSILVTDPGSCANISVLVPNNGVSVVSTTTPFSCAGGGTATAFPSGGGGQYTYQWLPGGQITQTISGLAAGTYTCIVSDQNNCTFTTTCTVANSSPMQVNTLAAPPSIACGGSTQITATCNYTGTYSWVPTSTLSNPTAATTTASPTVTTTYTVTVNSTCGVMSQTLQIVVDTTNNFAEGLCLVTVDSASNHIRLVWENTLGFQNGNWIIFKETPASSGTYTQLTTLPAASPTTYLDVTSNAAVSAERYKIRTSTTCGNLSPMSLPHRSIRLDVTPGGSGTWNLIWNHTQGFTFNIYNIWRGTSTGNLSFLATVQGNIQSYLDANAPAGDLFYAVEAVHPSGCTASSPTTVYPSAWSNVEGTNPNSIRENAVFRQLSIWPNPSSGQFTISLESDRMQEMTMMITDAPGRLLKSETLNIKAGLQQLPVSLTDLPRGIYFIHLRNDVAGVTRKLVIE